MASATITNDSRLDLSILRRLAEKPPLFAPHEAPFWDDPYIATQMLAAHLDPNWEAASRPHATIERSVDWIVRQLDLQPGATVLDVGCGPGLYCTRFARHGLAVTGIDLSRNSIDYARKDARKQGLTIDYVSANYLTLDETGRFDVVGLIYFDFGVLSNVDRDELLRRIHRALKPGGHFVVDVRTPNRPTHDEGAGSWEIRSAGFWRPTPYLELTRYFHYPEADVDLRQTLIVDQTGDVSVYRIWEHYYSLATIATVLGAHGFQLNGAWSDLTGAPDRADSESLGIVARK